MTVAGTVYDEASRSYFVKLLTAKTSSAKADDVVRIAVVSAATNEKTDFLVIMFTIVQQQFPILALLQIFYHNYGWMTTGKFIP